MSLSSLTKTIQQLRKGFQKLATELKQIGYYADNPQITDDGYTLIDVYALDPKTKQKDKTKCLFRVKFLEITDDGLHMYKDLSYLEPEPGNRVIRRGEKKTYRMNELQKEFANVCKQWYPEMSTSQIFEEKPS